MKLLILGYGRHGKDTLAEIFRDHFEISFISSSFAVCEIVIFPALKDKYGYHNPEECYQDRSNHRQEWFELISDYNKEDPSRLCQDILEMNDCYVGMRSKRELDGSRHLFDLVIFVDASERHPSEGKESCTISPEDADIIIANNGSLEQFKNKAIRLGNMIF